jgi:transposase
MNPFLAELSEGLPAGTHAVVVLDRAGWHTAADLDAPSNLTLVHLPAYSPELNPVEKVGPFLRERCFSHRLFPTVEAVVDACCRAWNRLLTEPGRLRSLTTFPWLPPSITIS